MSLDSRRRPNAPRDNVVTVKAHPGPLPQPIDQISSTTPSATSSQQQTSTTSATNNCGQDSSTVDITYVDLKIIGNGSFGVVYQATLTSPTHEQIAIKKVLQDKRFKNRELQIMRRLDHCNVVKLKYYFHTVGERNNEVYLNLVLEYIPETLYKMARTHNRSRQQLPMILVKLYMYQLFRSLNYIHSMNICHRDIKPQNLLLNPETGVLKLCDFGSAKTLVKGETNVAYICSRYYRAPELIFGATDYTTKIDIWSAGCVMAELILGEPMFPGESGVDQLVEIIKVLGTPTREQMKSMNQNYQEFKFPIIKAQSWHTLFQRFRAPPETACLVSKLLEYTPTSRLTPLEACAHNLFDELRSPNHVIQHNGRDFPPLFNFTEEELKGEPHLATILIPRERLQSSNNNISSGISPTTVPSSHQQQTQAHQPSPQASTSSTTVITSSATQQQPHTPSSHPHHDPQHPPTSTQPSASTVDA